MTYALAALLAAIVTGTPASGPANTYSTLPVGGQGLVTYALRHPYGNPANCQSDWGGFEPTREVYGVFVASCATVNAAALSDDDRRELLRDLPYDCPPSPSGCASVVSVSSRTGRRLSAGRR
jgi:hypothetical protein